MSIIIFFFFLFFASVVPAHTPSAINRNVFNCNALPFSHLFHAISSGNFLSSDNSPSPFERQKRPIMNRSNARIARFAVFAAILIFCGFILSKGSLYLAPDYLKSSTGGASPAPAGNKDASGHVLPADDGNSQGDGIPVAQKDPLTGQAATLGHQPKTGPETVTGASGKVKACLVSLARNSDKDSLLGSIREVEDRFNRQFKYDWVFLNDAEFSEEFKSAISAAVSGNAKFGLIPKEQWSYPAHIDQEKAALAREKMVEDKVIYGGSVPYRHMCRYESGFFWRHELMMEYEYYWRVEPDIKIYCDVTYDVFQWMKDHNKKYSFTISLPEYDKTIPTLWLTTKKFIDENPLYLHPHNMLEWISHDNGKTYNGCHFWSNFEIASLDFWRSDAYTKYFEALDEAGGFFYERWGDAPVHSIAAALFLDKDEIHFFEDIGYFHVPFHNCPVDPEVRKERRCNCDPNQDFTWRPHSCTTKYFTVKGLKRPKGWENFTS